MTAHFHNLADDAVAAEIDHLIALLAEEKSRRRTLEYFYSGWILESMAERILVSLDEASP